MANCRYCHGQWPDITGAAFCPFCGKRLADRTRQSKLGQLPPRLVLSQADLQPVCQAAFGPETASQVSQSWLLQALERLAPAQLQVLIRYYGLDGNSRLNDRQIAEEAGVDTSRVYTVRHLALRRLREHYFKRDQGR